jgi:hypothetical protein
MRRIGRLLDRLASTAVASVLCGVMVLFSGGTPAAWGKAAAGIFVAAGVLVLWGLLPDPSPWRRWSGHGLWAVMMSIGFVVAAGDAGAPYVPLGYIVLAIGAGDVWQKYKGTARYREVRHRLGVGLMAWIFSDKDHDPGLEQTAPATPALGSAHADEEANGQRVGAPLDAHLSQR